MTRRLLAIAAAGLVLGGVASASGSAGLPKFLGCEGTHAATRPHSILIACGDGNFYIDHLHWSSWTAQTAAAVGVAHVNDCTPYCAAGHFHSYPGVSVRLTRPEACTHGRLLFTRIEWRYTRKRPAGQKHPQVAESAPFFRGSGCS